ncbi:MAG: hypothetical protein V4857_09255 [Pseudomonadota bacterium]
MKKTLFCLAVAGASLAALASGVDYSALPWWSAGETREFPREQKAPNEHGVLTTLNAAGPTDTRNHAFFKPMGSNGRACISCHQPADGMSLSVRSIKARWGALREKDPLFAAFDGANCPGLPMKDEASHSLLLERGLFRIARPWPPRTPEGKPVKPEFTIEVVRDPTGCNTSPVYGLTSASPQLSVYRRPRPVANLKYITAVGFSFDPKSGLPLQRDPETGAYVSEALMADTRVLTLKGQAIDAIKTHLQMQGDPSPAQLRQILEFESQLSSAQSHDQWGGSLAEGGAEGGPAFIESGSGGVLQSTSNPIWKEFLPWKAGKAAPSSNPEQQRFRESVARGATVFAGRQFLIKGSAGINSMGFGDPVRNSCAMCHNMHRSGIDIAPGRIDLGTTNEPHAKPSPELPLFKLTCKPGFKPHPFLGKVVHTQDPGYALSTGRCEDIGKVTTQQMRGLAGRAPYFVNGSAANLREIVDIYDRRYNIEFTEQEKLDLVNLMKVL